MRTHIMMPEEIIKQLNSFVGVRGRSKFIVDAVIERINRMRLKKAVAKVAGSLKDRDIPGWETGKKTSFWVHNLRQKADKNLE